jgi:hypothetical protein
MTMRRNLLHGILFTSLFAVSGCGSFASGGNSLDGVWGVDDGAHPAAELAAPAGIVMGHGTETGARFIAPAGPVDTVDLARGALLDVWLNDGESDLRTVTSERSLGTAVVRGDFFRYNTVNSDPDLRGFWGQPLVLKWSALLEIPEGGAHVFESALSKERGWGAMEVRTLVRVNEETVFEEDVRVFGSNQISRAGSRVLTLAPGFHKLEVWLAVENRLELPAATQLGTFLKIRAPGIRTAEPVSRVWHRVR